jgi:hypothetical protein
MILAHSQWKFHLKKAIDTGQTQFTVEGVRDHHICDLGKWLDSAEGKSVPDYSNLCELHSKFHQEAANVLNLALAGHKGEAEAEIEFGGKFSSVSAMLVNKLAQLEF